jgi:hypothetical protein
MREEASVVAQHPGCLMASAAGTLPLLQSFDTGTLSIARSYYRSLRRGVFFKVRADSYCNRLLLGCVRVPRNRVH